MFKDYPPPPSKFVESYTEEDKTGILNILDWMRQQEISQSHLARLVSISATTVSLILSGKYATSPSKHLSRMSAAINTLSERASITAVPYIETTTVYKLAELVCERARQYSNFGVLTGYVGIGKTAALKQYIKKHEHTILIESNPKMSAGVLLRDLLSALSAPESRSLDGKFSNVIDALTNTTKLIIVDEAETLLPQCLHYLRRIRDKAQVGIVLSGTERLLTLLKVEHGQFDQIRSRVGFWPATIRNITREDADAIAQTALSDQGELNQEVLDALWDYCQGSARMLVENFLPALRDYGLNRFPLTPKLIDEIAKKALFMPPRRHAI